MIRRWPGQTKEEWLKEWERDRNLTPEERDREIDEYIKSINEEWNQYKKEIVAKKGQLPSVDDFKKYDHPNSLEDSEATIIWVVIMFIGSIFKGNWAIWIIATIIWWKYITRHD